MYVCVCERSKNRGKRRSKLYSSKFLCIAVQLFTSERTGRSIRNVVSLSVEVASAFWWLPIEAEGGNDSHSIGFLLLFPYLLGLVYSTLSLPDGGIESVSGTLMPYGTHAGFFVFVSRTMGFVSREISWAPQSVYSAHCNCRQMISSNASPEFLRQKRKIK